MFDEVYYAKDAKAILDGRMDPKRDYPWEPGDVVSWAHPDAGKMAIAVGIALFGDRPLGWRLPSAVAGLVLLSCVYPIARRLGLTRGWALVALLLAAADLLGIAQSRIATLDVFVALWTVVCVLFALRYVQGGRSPWWLLACGLAGGLAVATKWSGALALAAAVLLIVFGRRVAELAPHEDTACTAQPARSGRRIATVASVVLALAILPAAVYLASYVPYFADGHSIAHFRELHSQMLHFNLTLSATHSYASAAPTWILDYRPVWYSFEDKGGYFGVVAMGNPLLWWAGLAALVAAPILAIWRRLALPLVPALLVVVLYVPWFAASRTSFLYYMTPVAPFLAILVAAVAATLVGLAARPGLAVPLSLATLAAVVTAIAWDAIGRASTFLFWELPGRTADAVALATASVAVAAVIALVAGGLVAKRTRPAIVAVLLGCIVGIAVPFLPIVLDLGMPAERFYRLIWFTSWI
jgi:dolichyl-phosphate-mannose--protein O-mannosyl transferase